MPYGAPQGKFAKIKKLKPDKYKEVKPMAQKQKKKKTKPKQQMGPVVTGKTKGGKKKK